MTATAYTMLIKKCRVNFSGRLTYLKWISAGADVADKKGTA